MRIFQKKVQTLWRSLYFIASAVCQDPDTVLIRVDSMIESTINSNEFRSKDGTVVRIPDADFKADLEKALDALLV
ncbi:hypothetical protein TNCV_4582671 [Trichonephila clavipes]|nr:hypothetical protein TNCV_4582671 [Trichonephila clavipes]